MFSLQCTTFYPGTVREWNQLPTRTTDIDDTEGFKAALDGLLRGGSFAFERKKRTNNRMNNVHFSQKAVEEAWIIYKITKKDVNVAASHGHNIINRHESGL